MAYVDKAAKAAVKVAKQAIKNPETIGEVVKAAETMAPLVQKVVESDAVRSAATTAADTAGKVAQAASDAAKATTAAASAAASNVSVKAGNVKQAATDAVKKRSDKQRQHTEEKARRRALLRAASVHMSAKELLSRIEDAKDNGVWSLSGGYRTAGCFAVATYKAAKSRMHATAYDGVFVGCGADLGRAVLKELTGLGNPDVYADFKYKRDVQVFLFPCALEDMEEKAAHLSEVLGADASYNGDAQRRVARLEELDEQV